MFSTKKINKNVVAVIYSGVDAPCIALRPSGKQYYGTETQLVGFNAEGTELIIDRAVADEYGIDIVLIN